MKGTGSRNADWKKLSEPSSLYKHSVSLKETDPELSKFYLAYSAVLGFTEAYPKTAEMFSKSGNEEFANLFYSLAALADDTRSAVTVAARYAEGIGTKRCEEYAKWHLDRLSVIPIYALKLSYRLRGVKAKEPPQPYGENYTEMLKYLLFKAEELEIDGALLRLSEILSERDVADASAMLGILILEGRCKSDNPKDGLVKLFTSAEQNSVRASVYLGELYSESSVFPRDIEKATYYYEKAGALGSYSSYEKLGDIYSEGLVTEKDLARAVKYYDKASREVCDRAYKKADKIKIERRKVYEKDTWPKEAFRLLAISASMGYETACLRLADCFYRGNGVEKSRSQAFTWYKEAADGNEKNAFYPLAMCYKYGIGTRVNFKLAKEYLEKAASVGSKNAEKELFDLMNRRIKKLAKMTYSTAMRLIYQKKYSLAKNFLELGMRLPDPKAIYTYGCLFEFGIDMPCDKDKAYEYYALAEKSGFVDNRARYKQMVLRMFKQNEI